MAPFYGWGSTATRLVPLRGGSLLFTTKFPDIPGTHFIDLGRMNERLSRPWSHPLVSSTGPLEWKSSVLTASPLLQSPSDKFSSIFDSTLKFLRDPTK